jgi:hypothetical protein
MIEKQRRTNQRNSEGEIMKYELHREQRAVMYLRVASAQDDLGAVDRQREGCQRIAAQHGLSVVREYIDQGRPARLQQQIELQRLLTDLAEHRDVGHVVIFDYARLARDLASLDGIIRRIHLCGAEIATTTGVEVAERFRMNSLLDRVSEWAQRSEPQPPYPLSLLRAAHQGLQPTQALVVTALLPNGDTVWGAVTGIGSRLGISTLDGLLVEDVQAAWVTSAVVQQRGQR